MKSIINEGQLYILGIKSLVQTLTVHIQIKLNDDNFTHLPNFTESRGEECVPYSARYIPYDRGGTEERGTGPMSVTNHRQA